MRLAVLALACLAPAAAAAGECSSGEAGGFTFPWCGPGEGRPPGGSLTGSFLQDANYLKGDTDDDGDRQGFDLALRLPDPWLLSEPGARFLLGVRSVLDSSQARPRTARGAGPRQYDQVPTHATLGYETQAVTAYVLVGVANDAAAVAAWHALKTWEHDGRFRKSPLSTGRPVAVLGAQGRVDHVIALDTGTWARLVLAGTGFAQGTSLKVGGGAAAHVGLGTWEGTPRFAVSDLPMPEAAGTGVWVGIEYERVAYERLTHALGTGANRLSVVFGGSYMPLPGWPALSFTARRMLTGQLESARTPAVGEYRAAVTVPLPH